MDILNKYQIIAEIGSVHDGSLGNALKSIELAKKVGATCVKFQTHLAESETLKSAPGPGYFQAEPRYDYFQRTSFSLEQWHKLKAKADELEIEFISSPFSLEAVDLLENVGISCYKIPSGEVNNLPLIEKISKLNKPVIISSGMSSWDELDESVRILKNVPQLNIMQCTSEYPCLPENVGLNIITEIKNRYKDMKNLSVGFSDHTLGYAAPISAVAMGANIIEKHLTFSKEMYGSDAKNSMEPKEFSILTSELNFTWQILENPIDKNSIDKFSDMKSVFEKSLVSSRDIAEGEEISLANIAFKKPGTGIKARYYKDYLGKIVTKNIPKDVLINEKDLK